MRIPERLSYRIVDAFASGPFTGNPAAVVLPPSLSGDRGGAGGETSPAPPLPDTLLQALAAEMNLSETAFPGAALPGREPGEEGSEAPPGGRPLPLRWFTPTTEVTLCGHATLAAAHALCEAGHPGPWRFTTRSGLLTVEKEGAGRYRLDFPLDPPVEAPVPEGLREALGIEADVSLVFAHGVRAALLEVGGPEGGDDFHGLVQALAPDLGALGKVALPSGVMGVSVTVRGKAPAGVPALPESGGGGGATPEGVDSRGNEGSGEGGGAEEVHFHSRFFGPWVGVDEDPVTGMAHCLLGPWWALRIGTSRLRARQGGPRRGGVLEVEVAADRVYLVGEAVTVAEGTIRTGPRS